MRARLTPCLFVALVAGCPEETPVLDAYAEPDAGLDAASVDAFVAPRDAPRDAAIDFSRTIDALTYVYEWSCSGEVTPPLVAPSGSASAATRRSK